MRSSAQARVGGVAAAIAGLLFVLFGLVYYVFTHGSGGTGRGDTLFGLDYGEFGRMQVAWPVLLALGLLAYHATMLPHAGRLARRGLVASLAALGIHVVSIVLQYWVVDPTVPADFDSLPSTLGFFLENLSYLLLAVGMVLTGIAAIRADARPRWFALPLISGLLVPPTVIVPLLGFSDGSRTWEIVFTASRVPLALCFVLFGAVVVSATTATARLHPAGTPAPVGGHPTRQASRSIG